MKNGEEKMAENRTIDGLGEKLQSILRDPESFKTVMQLVSMLGTPSPAGGRTEHSEENGAQAAPVAVDTGASERVPHEAEKPEKAEKEAASFAKDPAAEARAALALPSFSHVDGMQKKGGDADADDRINLLLSIRPFLGERKRQRVDSLVKALGAAKMISAYRESELFPKFR